MGSHFVSGALFLVQLFKSCESRIRKIAACEGGTAGDRRLQENAQKALAAQLHGLSLAFRQQQKIYIQRRYCIYPCFLCRFVWYSLKEFLSGNKFQLKSEGEKNWA